MSFNILIVDDSNAMRSVIRKIISMSGFRVDGCFEAGNGREALSVLSSNWVDVILSDINMPEMNGLEFLETVRSHDLYHHIPVIMVSTEGSTERIQEAFENGARGFIKKPFLPEDIRKVLYQVVGCQEDGEYGGNAENPSDSEEVDF